VSYEAYEGIAFKSVYVNFPTHNLEEIVNDLRKEEGCEELALCAGNFLRRVKRFVSSSERINRYLHDELDILASFDSWKSQDTSKECFFEALEKWRKKQGV